MTQHANGIVLLLNRPVFNDSHGYLQKPSNVRSVKKATVRSVDFDRDSKNDKSELSGLFPRGISILLLPFFSPLFCGVDLPALRSWTQRLPPLRPGYRSDSLRL